MNAQINHPKKNPNKTPIIFNNGIKKPKTAAHNTPFNKPKTKAYFEKSIAETGQLLMHLKHPTQPVFQIGLF